MIAFVTGTGWAARGWFWSSPGRGSTFRVVETIQRQCSASLRAVTANVAYETVAWIERQMREVAREQGKPERADQALERYRAIDREVYATLAADEALLMRG